MTRDDADFAAYTAARWPFLVRTLVLLGASPAEAAALAQTGLAHCYLSWDRLRQEDDIDVNVYGAVLRGWHRSRRTAPEPEPRAVVDEPTDQLLLRWALEDQLAGLAPEHREVLVLRFATGLAEEQVADLLELSVPALVGAVARALAQIDLPALGELTR